MIREVPPALDAEKTGRDQLLANFRSPPGMPSDVVRSTLLVGARGSGKTMFLRRCRHLHVRGLALYGDLRKLLNAVSSDTGSGGLSFDAIPPSLEAAIQAKTIFILATWFAEQGYERGIPIPAGSLRRVFPRNSRPLFSGDTGDFLEKLVDLTHNWSLEEIPNGNYLSSFVEFLEGLSEACQNASKRAAPHSS